MEPRYACLSEAKASHSHRMWTVVSSSVPQLKFPTSSGSKKRRNPDMYVKIKALKVPTNGAASYVPPTGSLYREVLRTSCLFIHLYLLEFPKRSLPMICGENIQSPSTEPHMDRRHTYNGVQPCSSRWSLRTLLSLPQCHASFSILSTYAWVDQSPFSQRVITLNRGHTFHTCYRLPRDPG